MRPVNLKISDLTAIDTKYKSDMNNIERKYKFARIRQVSAMLFVYAIYYVCRLAFSASKKGMIEEGAYTLDYLAIFWIAMATLSVVCILIAGRKKR